MKLTFKMKLTNYKIRKTRQKKWDEVFQNPKAVSFETYQTGRVIINLKGTLNPQHHLARDVEDKEIEVPILAHLVHHQEKGYYLLDTGLDASYTTDPRGGLEGREVDEFYQNKNENIACQLYKNDIHLKGVFLSHLHADHAAGQRELPHDIPYVVGKGEYSNYRPEIHGNFLKGLETLYQIDFSQTREIPPLGHAGDLLGDGSLWAIHTPGHTPGHMSFLVNGLDGPHLLTMDACFIKENLKRRVAPSDYTWNVEMAQETLEKIIQFLEEYPQVRVGTGHDFLKPF
jgi:N-acyl homoserine lactone hydrolase